MLAGVQKSSTHLALDDIYDSIAELKSIAVFFEKALREETAESLRQTSKLRTIRHFVEDLVERAEKKRSMSERRHDGIESQLKVLRRVLNRLDDA